MCATTGVCGSCTVPWSRLGLQSLMVSRDIRLRPSPRRPSGFHLHNQWLLLGAGASGLRRTPRFTWWAGYIQCSVTWHASLEGCQMVKPTSAGASHFFSAHRKEHPDKTPHRSRVRWRYRNRKGHHRGDHLRHRLEADHCRYASSGRHRG